MSREMLLPENVPIQFEIGIGKITYKFGISETPIENRFQIWYRIEKTILVGIVTLNRENKWFGTHMGIAPNTNCTKHSFDECCRTLATDYAVELRVQRMKEREGLKESKHGR